MEDPKLSSLYNKKILIKQTELNFSPEEELMYGEVPDNVVDDQNRLIYFHAEGEDHSSMFNENNIVFKIIPTKPVKNNTETRFKNQIICRKNDTTSIILLNIIEMSGCFREVRKLADEMRENETKLIKFSHHLDEREKELNKYAARQLMMPSLIKLVERINAEESTTSNRTRTKKR